MHRQVHQNVDLNENNSKLRRDNEILISEIKNIKLIKEGLEKQIIELQKNNNHLENYQSGFEDLENRIRTLVIIILILIFSLFFLFLFVFSFHLNCRAL